MSFTRFGDDRKTEAGSTFGIRKMDGRKLSDLAIGQEVEVVQKHHQRSGELISGFIKRILTRSPNHPHGIKVQLDTGEVGRVKNILEE